MNTEEIVKLIAELRRYGLTNGGSLEKHLGIIDVAADLIESLQAKLDEYKSTDLTAKEIFQMRREWRDTEKGLRESVSSLRQQLAASQRRERAAVEDLEWLAGTTVDSLRCNICKYNPNDMGCELDGSQFDDDGECHFTWRGPQDVGKENTDV